MLNKHKDLDDPSLDILEIPLWLTQRREVSQGAKLAFGIILFHVKRQEDFAMKQIDYEVPSQALLSQAIAVSDRQFRQYVKELVKGELLDVGKSGWGKANQYELLKNRWLPRRHESKDSV